MNKLIFPCLSKLDKNQNCEDTNCIFNTQGEKPRCEYFDDEDVTHGYISEDIYPGFEEDTSYEDLGLADCLPEDF